MTWVIVRTEYTREHAVAASIRALGFDAWVPAQIVVSRSAASRRVSTVPRRRIRELPILPGVLFAVIPRWAVYQAECDSIRYMKNFELAADQTLIQIPDAEIVRFKSAIDAENTAALALEQNRSRKQRARWRSLHDALAELIEAAKGEMAVAS